MRSPKLTARAAGLLYLVTILGGVAGLLIGDGFYVPGDAAATAARILNAEELYRLGFVATLVGVMAYVAVTALLYELLRPAGRTLSLTAACFSLTGCAVWAVGTAFAIEPLLLLKPAPYLAAMPASQPQALAMVSIRLNAQTLNIGMAFFGVYMLLLGGLVIRSRFLPWPVGALLALAGGCALLNAAVYFLAPAYTAMLSPWTSPAGLIGEGGLTLWLLLFGVNEAKWRTQATEARLAQEPR